MAITATEMSPALGQRILVKFESMRVLCTVLDVKNVYGRERLLVAPIEGNGQQWVELSRIAILGQSDKPAHYSIVLP
jgi:hypothetical protein